MGTRCELQRRPKFFLYSDRFCSRDTYKLLKALLLLSEKQENKLKTKQVAYRKKSEIDVMKYMARITWLSKDEDSQLQIMTNLVKTNSNHQCL